jgi:hypothetical protein
MRPQGFTTKPSSSDIAIQNLCFLIVGKDVQFEYRYVGYESYWLTHQTDVHWRPKVRWEHVKNVIEPKNGYSWMIHFCGIIDEGLSL